MSKQNDIEIQATSAVALEQQVANKMAELKELEASLKATWKNVEEAMIANNIKQIKGSWGTLTIAERLNWDVDMNTLPAKFRKIVPDTTKISTEFRLYGKAPKGCTPSYSKYLTKRIKDTSNDA